MISEQREIARESRDEIRNVKMNWQSEQRVKRERERRVAQEKGAREKEERTG